MPKVTVTGRLLNNAVFEPKENETSGKMQYSALVLLDKGQDEKIIEARDEALAETFGKKIPKKYDDWTVREGDDEEFELTFGNLFINSKNNKKPRVLVRENGELRSVDEEEGLIYAGCRVAVSIDVYAYKKNTDKKIPNGCSTGLRAVMFQKHDEPLSDFEAKDEEFDDIDSDTEAPDLN